MLDLEDITSGYGDLEVIHDFSMRLKNREIACILGPNGSGKSTILKTIVGILKPTQGRIVYEGKDITNLEPHEILRKGICLLPQGRTVFPLMTVGENLQMGAYTIKDRKEARTRFREVYDLFPILEERRTDIASKLSGGEQAMLCIARALMTNPKIMLLDEPSLGLAPKVVDHVYQKIVEINSDDTSMIIVEQNVGKVLNIANYAHVIHLGRKRFEGRCEALLGDDRLKKIYFGVLQNE